MPVTINGTTGIAGVDGSASTPAVQGSDTNTGEFFPAADTIAWTTGGSERMRVDSSGNVGIGTNSPGYKLDVQGSSSGAFSVNIQNTNSGSSAQSRATFTSTSNTLIVGSSNDPNLGGGGFLYNGSVVPLTFFTNATERMRIDSSGNVGINSTNPTQYDTSGGRILNIRGTASNSSPATIFMNGNSSVPGAGYYTQEVFSIGVTASQEISRVTGTGANGFRSMIRISLCGHTGAKGNGHIYAMYYWDGGTAAPVQIFRYDSGTNIPGLSFNTSTSNVLITNLSSSDGSNLFQGVMTIEYFLPIDFAGLR